MPETLKQKATNAFVWDMVGVLAKQSVGFVVSIFLARLLGPSEFGVVAMALVFISISQIFADFGFTSGLIQNKDNTSLTYSSVFYLNIAVGISLFVIFWFVAPYVAEFYATPQMTDLVRYLSLNFIFSSFNQVQQAILRRNIEFKKITTRVTIAHLVSGAISIFLAFQGMGVYALVAQNLLAAAINTIILWRVSEWKPRLEFSWLEVRKLTGFSVYVFLSQMFNQLVTQLDTLIVGKVFSATTLGFYSRATSLNSLVTTFSSTSIARVAFPLMSHIQDDKERFESVYLKMLELIAFASFCLSGCLILSGRDIIMVLFGEAWLPSIFIFQILVLKSFTYPVNLLIVNTFLAGGKSKENFWFGNIKRSITFSPLIVAVTWGFEPFLYSVVAAAYLNWLLSNWFVTISFKISLAKQSIIIVPYLLTFVLILSIIHYLFQLLPIDFPLMGFAEAFIFLVIYFTLNLSLKTKGYVYFVQYLLPIWNQWRGKLGRK